MEERSACGCERASVIDLHVPRVRSGRATVEPATAGVAVTPMAIVLRACQEGEVTPEVGWVQRRWATTVID